MSFDQSQRGWPKHNIFFAVMPPYQARAKISLVFASIQTRYPIRKALIADKRLHISLECFFAGDYVSERIVSDAKKVGSAIRFVAFELVMDRVLSFRNRQTDKPLVIAASAQSSLRANELVHEIRYISSILTGSYPRNRRITPHLTLAWDRYSLPEETIEPLYFPVSEIALIHSHVGQSRYDILGRWPLVPAK